MSDSAALLPNGLGDLLAPKAQAEADLIEAFMAVFSSFAYERVKPPLVEFEESLFAPGPGQSLMRNTFRLMDPVSQRMMGVRADTTAQTARIATSRLSKEKRPLRLSYAADVLRVNGTQLRPERQFTQVGCEMIGVTDVRDDVELVVMALKALQESGITSLSVDLTVPALIPHLLDEGDNKQAVMDALARRDEEAIAAMKIKAGKDILALMQAVGPADKSVAALEKLSFSGQAEAEKNQLIAAAKEVRLALNIYGLSDIAITIDPLESAGFPYQTGISFTLFAKAARGELGRGGRYSIEASDKTEEASGFTLYMDTILRAVPEKAPARPEAVSAATDWAEIKALQDKGLSVKRG